MTLLSLQIDIKKKNGTLITYDRLKYMPTGIKSVKELWEKL